MVGCCSRSNQAIWRFNNNVSIYKAWNLVHRDYSKRIDACTHTYMHACMHARTHTHTHTHTEASAHPCILTIQNLIYTAYKWAADRDFWYTKVMIVHFAEKVNPSKRLRGGVEFLEEIPKTQSGKILRRVLKDKALQSSWWPWKQSSWVCFHTIDLTSLCLCGTDVCSAIWTQQNVTEIHIQPNLLFIFSPVIVVMSVKTHFSWI